MSGDYSRFTHRPERSYSGVGMQQGRVQLDSDWNEQSDILHRRLRVQAMDTFGPSAVPEPTTPDAFKLTALAGPPVDLAIGVGRLYLDGLLAEIFPGESYTYRSQKYYPDPPALPTTGEAIAYLDVWEREVTYIEDSDLLEVALGGPDTTTRRQTIWQVKWQEVAAAMCGTDLDALFPPSAGRATTSAIAPPGSNDPCILSPSGGYRGLENRLYRVEVHTAGPLNTARFKWSRDNASIVSRVDDIAASGTQTVLSVARIGRDKVLRFSVGDWVEVTDDHREWMGEAGEIAQILDTSESALTITLDRAIPTGTGRAFGATPLEIASRHTRVRKWDQSTPGNTLDADGLIAIDGTNVHLEDGVFVQLALDPAGGTFHVGDYWVFAARTADASVEPLTSAAPRGIDHHYTQLGTLAWVGTPAVLDVDDCRTLWPDPNCCTISVRPGQSIQLAIDRLPPEGGCICLLPGIHEVETPVLIDARRNICIEGLRRASKVVTDPAVSGGAVFYIAGASQQVRLHDFLVFADDRSSLVTIAEGSTGVELSGMTLIDSASAADSCCVLLAGTSHVCIERSTLVGRVDVLQAEPERVAAVVRALAALRAPVDPNDPGDDVPPAEPPTPEAPPLRELTVAESDLFAIRTGIELHNAWGGAVRDNLISGLGAESLVTWRRPAPTATDVASVAVLPNLHQFLEANLATLEPVTDLTTLSAANAGVRATLLEDVDLRGNDIVATHDVAVAFARTVDVDANGLVAGRGAVLLGYAFDCGVRGNHMRVANDDAPVSTPDTLPEVVRARVRPGFIAVVTRFARGLDVDANTIEAQTAIGTTPGVAVPTSLATPYRASLLRLLRIGRVWRVYVEMAWLLLVIVRALVAATNPAATVAAAIETKAMLETRLYGRFLAWLGSTAWLPVFIGKARIGENRLQVTRYGVLLHQILTLGGLRITGNRVSGFTRTGIEVHPLFSVGLVDKFASWVHCALLWLIALLRLLRDRLAAMLDGEPVEEPAEPSVINAGTVAATSVSWLLYFSSRFCPPAEPGGGTGPGEEPESPAEDLEDALGDLLDHLNPAWIDDLVNQSYVIERNTLRGGGDGIVTGIDGSHVVGNHVSIELGTTVGFEALTLGTELVRQFEFTTFNQAVLFQSLMDLDHDMLLATEGVAWVGTHGSNAGFRGQLLTAIRETAAITSPDSPLDARITALHAALTASTPDLTVIAREWSLLLMAMWLELRGRGIVLRGADMVCADNRVRALRGCAPLVRRTRFTDSATGAVTVRSFFALPGVLPAVPAVGGIWQFSNFIGWSLDFVELYPIGKINASRVGILLWMLGTYLAMTAARDRRLAVLRNSIEEALAFGVRTLQPGGASELQVHDNSVVDAVRYGICHRGFGLTIGRDEAGMHAAVNRNTVVRTRRVLAPPASGDLAAKSLLADFAALMWIDNTGGNTLVGQNHGDGVRLERQRRAVHVATRLAGVNGNQVDATSDLAFEVLASLGLFNANVTHPLNDIVPAAVKQPPNVEMP